MAYIPEDFHQRIQENPQNNYPVLITLKEKNLPQLLEGKGQFVLENKIYSAQVTGQDIQSLSQHSDIESIEPDVEMHIME